MGCNCSVKTSKHDSIDSDMGSQNLGVPAPSFPMLGSQQRLSVSSTGGRSKVQLKPGHSLMDWIKLGRSGKDLTGVGGRRMLVTEDELAKHNTEEDAWLALRGNVYNITPYLGFHPGGVDELMRGAGKDATALFDEIHRWVNAESMLEKCLIGKLQVESPKKKSNTVTNGQVAPQFLVPATPALQLPRFDWYQSKETISLIVYTKWTGMREDLVIVDNDGRQVHVILYLKSTVFNVHIELEKEVSKDCKVNVSKDSGKVEVVLQKSSTDDQWSSIGKHLGKHNHSDKYADYNPAYRDCTVDKVEAVNKDTKLLTVRLPDTCTMHIPLGYHVYLQHNVAGMDIVRSYTAVLPSLNAEQDEEDGKKIYLMIKVYKDGAFTPWIDTLSTGDKMSVSSHDGSFEVPRLTGCTHLVMFAAGTGFTPMVKLINSTLVRDQTSRNIKLLFFNKTTADILWNDQLSALAAKFDRFTFTNCLSEAEDSWTGLRGRVTKEMVADFIPQLQDKHRLLICACGPTPFTQAVIKYCEELGHKEACHAFVG